MSAPTKPKAPPKRKLEEPKGTLPKGHRPRMLDRERQPLPEAYYDDGTMTYWLRLPMKDGYARITETALKRDLKIRGFSSESPNGLPSEVDSAIHDITLSKLVRYAGPLAGHSVGVCDSEGEMILVTSSPRLIEPVKGEWPLWHAILEGMFKEPGLDQTPYFYGWLKYACECLRSGKLHPAQVLAMAGERESAKSLIQEVLITPLLGGRCAKPYQFFTGGTSFNADTFAAEHLMIEDEVASTDIRARRNFGEKLKGVAANYTHRLHGKNKNALMLAPFWRVSISLNDDPESLLVLPPIDDGLEDKLILLRANKRPMPRPTGSPQEKSEFATALVRELPAFLHFLLNWQIPTKLKGRNGIKFFQHPELVHALQDLAPESRLWNLIERELVNHEVWSGTSSDLQEELAECREANRLFTWSNACGVYLGRLAKLYPERVASKRINHGATVIWTIHLPPTRV